MLRRPHYCCNCGEMVNRATWRWWNSRRFCELCETEFVFEEWWPRAVQLLFIGFSFAIWGLTAVETTPVVPEIKREVVFRQSSTEEPSVGLKNKKTKEPKPLEKSKPETALPRVVLEKTQGTEEARKLPSPVEKVVYCGVTTKKGTPCSRRVKEGTRCWQHKEIETSESP